MKLTIFLLLIKTIYSFNENNVINQISVGSLAQNIINHDVDNIYFSNDLKKIYSKRINIEQYDVTTSNPILTNKFFDISAKNNVNTVILEEPRNILASGINTLGNVFETFFVGFIILSIIRYVRNINTGSNSMDNMGISFFQNSLDDKDKINMLKANNISLTSWAGSKEIFEECSEVVSYLRNNTLYKNVGAEIPRGILLEGPPGTGKTLIAKAIATESNATFISVSASEFVELFVGIGASKVRNIFQKARQNSPSIIFIDEIDSVGRKRSGGSNVGGNEEREQTLNQLLAEMDGFTPNDNVIVIAATNRKDILDSALLRPGRFDRIINIPLPDRDSRKDILSLYMKNKNMEKNIKLDFLADLTSGFSGAQIKNLINEAAINAARLGNIIITQKNIEDALEKIIIGIVKKTDNRSEDTRLRVAIHEIGHATIAASFKEYFELQKVTIQSTYNGVGGYTIFSEHPEITESGLYTKDLLKKRLIIAMGGKAAEYIFYGRNMVSLGANKDLKNANLLARKMIENYGMGSDLEVFYDGNEYELNNKYSETMKTKIDYESLSLVNEAYDEAIKIIMVNKEKIHILINMLLSTQTLLGNIVYDNLSME
jgi:cell division protease FtsH